MQIILNLDDSENVVPNSVDESLQGNRFIQSAKFLPPIWGIVEYVNPNSTVDVRLSNGILLHNVTVPSSVFFSRNQDPQPGGRVLPPVGAEVLVLFPYGAVEEAVVIASRLPLNEENVEKAFFDSNVDLDIIQDRSGWLMKFDKVTGKVDISKGSIKIVVDPEAKESKVEDENGNKIVLDANGVTIVTGDAVNWNPCIVGNCLWNGAPHGGVPGGIQKLKGG